MQQILKNIVRISMFKNHLSLLILIILTGIAYSQTPQKTRILLIFDASGSMTAPFEKSSRFTEAKKMAIKMIDSFKTFSNVELALRVYGHQSTVDKKDCKDSRLEVPFSVNNHSLMKKRINTLVPKGWTPIAYSLQESEKDFPSEKNVRNLIIIITDGLEECTGDPCAISKALQSKGIFLKPFIIGLGSTEEFRLKFNCAGTYYDANTYADINNVIGVVVSQVMNATSCQINLLDKQIRPIETNVLMSIYDANTKKILHQYIHTMNGRGVPDTLFLDPLRRYDIVVHTMPPLEKKNVELIVGKHNIIPIDVPQGNIALISKGVTNYSDLKAVIKVKGKNQTINAHTANTTKRYLCGVYSMEILTTPRIYLDSVRVDENKTSTIEIPQPGRLQLKKERDIVVSIYEIKNGKTEWVCDVSDAYFQTIIMQPGRYLAICRNKPETRTIYTYQKEFIIQSATTTDLTL